MTGYTFSCNRLGFPLANLNVVVEVKYSQGLLVIVTTMMIVESAEYIISLTPSQRPAV